LAALTVALASHVAVPLHMPEHETLSLPGSQRTLMSGSVQLTSALQLPSQETCASALTRQTAGEIFSVIVPAAESLALMATWAEAHTRFMSSSLGAAGASTISPPATAMFLQAVVISARKLAATVAMVFADAFKAVTLALRSPSQPSPLAASEHPEAPMSRAAESGANAAVKRVIFLI
jgi:hypothetical protein